jgi:outer membrane lipopolysaccharide assembly protein LptE/RlpB
VGRPISLLLVLLAALTACGYSLVRYGGGLGEIRSVAVVTLANASNEPNAGVIVSDALRREFLRRGAVDVIDDPGAADLVVRGEVERVASDGRSFSSVDLALEFELTLEVDLHFDLADGSTASVGGRSQRESERYLASADLEATRKNRREALHRVASIVAGRVYDSLYLELAP